MCPYARPHRKSLSPEEHEFGEIVPCLSQPDAKRPLRHGNSMLILKEPIKNGNI